MMKYKGYIGHVTYDDDAKIFHGDVIGISDVITFQGKTVDEINQAFRDSVDDYLEWCEEMGEKPEKTYSGTLTIRIEPDLHAHLAALAQVNHMSLNSLIAKRLKKDHS